MQKRHHPARGQHLLVVVERPPRVARPVPDPPAARHRGAALPGAARARRRRAGSSARSSSATASSPRTTCARALKAKAEETIYDLFLWPSGQFEFREGEFPENIHITFETPVTPVILEGIRRVDEWQRIRAVFPTMETTFKRRARPPPPGRTPSTGRCSPSPPPASSLAEMSLELRRSEFETAALVFDLHARGLVAVEPGARRRARRRDPVGAIQALLALAYQRLAGAPLRRPRSRPTRTCSPSTA